MTKDEAIQAMREGHKVTHRHFSADEFIKMEGTQLVTEEGYSMEPYKFWMYRQYKAFETDWSIYKG